MKPEHWQQLDKLFHSALEREPEDRAAFLDEACAGDESLRKQVEALLAAHYQAGSFIEKPAMEVEARGVAANQENTESELTTGETFSHYRIVSKLGVGGMGVVYLAEDTTLGRQVAVKLLPADFTRDTDRVRRFQQEARAASALNHPNLVTIHEIGQVGARHFIAIEFIDGQTLRQRISGVQARTTGDGSGKSGTPLPLREVLNIAIQTADALAAAHEAGIVHRDIKPENIMVRRRDNYVKVLDFGLAKLTEGAVDTEAPTRAQIKTSAGVVMGTPSYMSPEQARGEQVDARTDIWSLGVVLYELVAGCGPFERSTPSEVIALILEREPPPLARFAREVPPELERIVNKALTKDKEERYQTAKDVLIDLRRLRQQLELKAEVERLATPASGSEPVATTDGSPAAVKTDETTARTHAEIARRTSSAEYIVSEIRQHRRVAFGALVILFIAVVGGGFGLYKFLTHNRTNERSKAASSMQIARLTNTGDVDSAAISPDGKYVAYVVGEPEGQSVRIKQVNTNADRVIVPPDKAGYGNLNFSPDSSYLLYQKGFNQYRDGELEQVPVLGGASKKLVADVGSPVTFSPDGSRYAFVRSSREGNLLIVRNGDGIEQELARHTPGGFWGNPAWSPDGKLIAWAYPPLSGERYLALIGINVETGRERQISSHKWQGVFSIAWLPDVTGLVLSASDKAGNTPFHLWQVPYPDGEVRQLNADLTDYGTVSMSADGRILAAVQAETLSNIWVAPNGDANRARQITPGIGKYDVTGGLSWTPDGKIVFVSDAAGGDKTEIWIMDMDGGNQRQLTEIGNVKGHPDVTPDGRYVVFTDNIAGRAHIFRIDIDGSNPKQLTNGLFDTRPRCSPDSQWVIYGSAPDQLDPLRQYNRMLWKVPIDGGTPVQLSDNLSWGGVVSPDGTLIAAMYRDAPEKFKIAIIPFAGGPPIKTFDTRTNNLLWWTADGRAITYKETRDGVSNIWSQPIDGRAPKQLTNFTSGEISFYAWSRDGKLACSRSVTTRDVVLIKDF